MKSRCLIHQSAVYRIRVYGRLSPEWSERLQGMAVLTLDEGSDSSSDPQGTVAPVPEVECHAPITELMGLLPDQAALMGVLQELYINGVPLLSTECLSFPKQIEQAPAVS